MATRPHFERFTPISDGCHTRYQAIMRLSHNKQNALLAAERSALEADQLGLVQRERLWATVYDTHRAFQAFDGPVVDVALQSHHYRDAVPFTDSELPKAFFLNFDQELGLHVVGEFGRNVEGAYFVECMIKGKKGYRFVAVTETPFDIDGERVTLGESLLEQTKVAVGFVELGQSLDESIDYVTGDPAVCRAVQTAGVREAFIGGVDLTATLSLDFGKAKNASPMGSNRMRLVY